LKQQIQQLQQQIQALDGKGLSDDEKKAKTQTLESQVSELQTEYLQALQNES
jgi:hypothetical protein